jgi:hypothetical protein
MENDQKVSPEEILRSAGADKPVSEGTFLQRTGLILAAFVGATGAFVIIALVCKWVFYAPAVPVIQPGTEQTTAKAILDNYRTLQQIALEPLTALFDSIIVKVLLPVFTTILGFIFGSQANKTET